MKITPLEIRQKTFEKKLRGYDKDEVAAFLQSMSQEWEQVQEEVKELRLRNEAAEKEIKQLREVENSLFKTLKTAEDTGANLIDQATKTAELHMRETQMNADALLNEAKTKARAAIDDAESKARGILEKMDQDLQTLKMEYRSLENLRDIIIAELRNLSNDTLSRVDKIEAKAAQDAALVKERMAETAAEIAQESGAVNAPEPAKQVAEEKTEPKMTENSGDSSAGAQAEAEIDWTDADREADFASSETDEDSTLEWSEEANGEEEDVKVSSHETAPAENTAEPDDEDSSFFDQIK